MKNKKKLIMIIGASVAVVAAIVLGIILLNNNSKSNNITHIVTFMLENDEPVEMLVKDGKTTRPIEAPIKEGYVFQGWILNGDIFDFDTIIKEDISLSTYYIAEEVYIEKLEKEIEQMEIENNNPSGQDNNTTSKKDDIEVTKISLNYTTLSLSEGDTSYLIATVSPMNATNRLVTWESSDSSIVTVKNGKVSAIKKGTATITAKSSNGKSVTCTVTVKDIQVDKVKVESKYSVLIGKTTTILATVSPNNATNKTVTYTSSDTSIATVNNQGVVKGIKKGTVNITIKASNGVSATTTIEVVDTNIPVTSIETDKSSYTINDKEYAKISTTVKPSNATDKTLKFSSSSPDIVSVDEDGNIHGLKPGKAMIIIQGNGAQTNVMVTVKEIVPTDISVAENATLRINTTKDIVYRVIPVTSSNKTITFTSSNPNVATVDQYGRITAKKAGKITITAKTYNGISKTIEVNVYDLTCGMSGTKIDYENEVCYYTYNPAIICPDGYTQLGISNKCSIITDYKEPTCPEREGKQGVFNKDDGYCYYGKANLTNNTQSECVSVTGRTWVKGACYYVSGITGPQRVQINPFVGTCPTGYEAFYLPNQSIFGCYKYIEGEKQCTNGTVKRGNECHKEYEAERVYQ